MTYVDVKLLHQALVLVSVLGFITRASAAMLGAGWVRHRLARTLPHLVDTALLASGIWLAVTAWLSIAASAWLLAKLTGLVVYIVLGAVAMRAGFPFRTRMAALVLALLMVSWMVSVARSKNPLGFLGGLLV